LPTARTANRRIAGHRRRRRRRRRVAAGGRRGAAVRGLRPRPQRTGCCRTGVAGRTAA